MLVEYIVEISLDQDIHKLYLNFYWHSYHGIPISFTWLYDDKFYVELVMWHKCNLHFRSPWTMGRSRIARSSSRNSTLVLHLPSWNDAEMNEWMITRRHLIFVVLKIVEFDVSTIYVLFDEMTKIVKWIIICWKARPQWKISKTRYCKKGSIRAWVEIIQTRSMISFPRDFDERFSILEDIKSDKIILRNITQLS